MKQRFSGGVLGLVICLCLAVWGCAGCRGWSCRQVITWADLLQQLADFDRIARLDVPSSSLVASTDPSGGNDDFNHFLRKSTTPGWVVLADLKGPGYVSRFWFTGPSNGDYPLRFYFDGETNPRIHTTLNEFCGNKEPFHPPLANCANYCWYSFVPIPYHKRLIIETRAGGYKPGGWPRLFYQINYASLPRGQTVESFPRVLSSNDLTVVQQVRAAWNTPLFERRHSGVVLVKTNSVLPAGASVNLFQLAGPAVLRTLWIQPDMARISSPLARERILREVVLRIRWNGSSLASVEVPLGDFFGSVWQRTRYQSMYFGLTNNTFVSEFPMPFEGAAEISLENQGMQAVSLQAGVGLEAWPQWDPSWGYFHCGWYRTGPADVGRPHPILRIKGKGKYIGCILAVTSVDPSFWILEGDEFIRKDNEVIPGWRGTGLEDYFNGGWYYQNVMTFPLHGLPFKAPFRTVQYMLHCVNPVLFDSSLDMVFERGPDNASHGWMESVAFYYMDRPVPAFVRLGLTADRRPPSDPLARATLMTEIWNYERFGDYQGATEYIDRYLEQYTNFPFTDILRLRQVAYTERERGFEFVRRRYEQVAASATNALVRQFANMLLWYQQSPSNTLLGAYANMPAKVFLDGREIGTAGNPDQMMMWGLQVGSGKHVLAMQAPWKSYPDWIQLMLRTHQGDIFTTPEWKYAINPPPGWLAPDYDDRSWSTLGGGTKGPPEEPFIWVMPDPFVDMQSKASGLRPAMDWPDHRGTVVYRKVFDLP